MTSVIVVPVTTEHTSHGRDNRRCLQGTDPCVPIPNPRFTFPTDLLSWGEDGVVTR